MKASNLACVGKCEKSAHQTLADAKQLLHHLDRLEAADHARHGAENAGLRARRHGAVGRRLWEQAAIVWARGAVLVRLEGAEGGELSVERSHRSRHQWELGQVAGIVEQIARGEIVRAVGDDVEAAQDIERILRDQPRRIELRLHMRVEPLDGGRRALGLGAAHMAGVVHDLPLEIVEAHPVIVDDADLADARRGQIQKERRAEAAGADHEHARRLQALLAFAADLLQHQMALVAFDFVFGEHGGTVGPYLAFVIAGLDPAIQSTGNTVCADVMAWMPGSSPGMTALGTQPVEPKPPGPRFVAPSASTTASST